MISNSNTLTTTFKNTSLQQVNTKKLENWLMTEASGAPDLSYALNFGPQHPSAHGVLRLVLEMSGETVVKSDPHIGLLHRGTEKLIEHKTYLQAIPYFDRLDYVSMMTQEHGFVLCIEKLTQLEVPARAQHIRVLMTEITRILNHLMAITTHALDIGALSPFLYGFEEREKLMEFYERTSGARMHAAFFRFGGLAKDLPKLILKDIYNFVVEFRDRSHELDELLTNDRIWKQRTQNIGRYSLRVAEDLGMSGALIRGAGEQEDFRKTLPYEVYPLYDFNVPIGYMSDCYERYLIRLTEMRESLRIMQDCCNRLPAGPILAAHHKYTPPARSNMKSSMEDLINHFKYYSSNFVVPEGHSYTCIESPKGCYGITVVSDGRQNKPVRCQIKAPGFLHIRSFEAGNANNMLADAVAVIGTLDIVFGEIDR